MLDALPAPLWRRCRHVVTENARVKEVVRALREDKMETVGRLLTHSHRSMAEDLEVSHPDVDALVVRLRSLPGVAGARITGGGFGGMVVALVEATRSDAIVSELAPLRAFIAEPALGACEVTA
jgi:galactokinase